MKRLATTIFFAGMLALTGCSTTPPSVSKATDEPASVGAATPAASRVATFGDTVTYSNGVAVTVTAKTIDAGQYAYGAIDGKITVVSIAITNGSKEEINGALMSLPNVSYGETGKKADIATDTSVKFDVASTILAGETKTVQSGHGIPVAELANVRVEVNAPDFKEKAAIFKGAVS